MFKYSTLLAFVVGGAGGAFAVGSYQQAGGDACVEPAGYGAHPDDGRDDRSGLQAAINAAAGEGGPGCVQLAPGRYDLTWRDGPDFAYSLLVPGVEIAGAGRDATTLAMLGSAGGAGWRFLSITGTGAYLHDLRVDGAARTNTSEQTHLIQLWAPTADTQLERLDLFLPELGPSSGGDCIKLQGGGDNVLKVRRTVIRDVKGVECDRSFVSIQRGVEQTVIENAETIVVGDQAIDLEPSVPPSWNCDPAIRDLTVRNSRLMRGSQTEAYTVALGGEGCNLAEGVTIANTIIGDGALSMIDVRDVLLSGLTLRNQASAQEPTLKVMKRAVNVRVVNCSIERVDGSPAGNAVEITHASGASPTDVTLDGTTVVQRSAGTPIEALSLRALVLRGGSCAYAGPAPAPPSCVLARGIEQAVGAPVLVDYVWSGTTQAARATGLADGPPVLVRVTSAPALAAGRTR